jgi:hypothetical protein
MPLNSGLLRRSEARNGEDRENAWIWCVFALLLHVPFFIGERLCHLMWPSMFYVHHSGVKRRATASDKCMRGSKKEGERFLKHFVKQKLRFAIAGCFRALA